MNQIQTSLLMDDTASTDGAVFDSSGPEEGYSKADHIVEWHVQTDSDDMAEGSFDGCGGCGCGCGGCFITF